MTNPPPSSTTTPPAPSASIPPHARRPSTSSITHPTPPTTSIPIPHRHPKSPSSDFAELHQSLEQESEAVVNRLLREITFEQGRLHSSASSDAGGEAAAALGRATPSGIAFELESVAATMGSDSTAGHRGGVGALFSAAASDRFGGEGGRGLSRAGSFGTRGSRRSSRSRRSSVNAPPSPIPIPGQYMESGLAGGVESPVYPPMLSRSTSHSGSVKDDATFYLIESQNVARENEMLKVRIRELERQVRMLTGEGAVGISSKVLPGKEVEEEEEGDGALTPTSSVMPEFDVMSVRSEGFGRGTPARVGTPGGEGSVRGR